MIELMQSSKSLEEWFNNRTTVFNTMDTTNWYKDVVISGIMWDIIIKFKD